jgi:LmbE family N-acetylglucosaminyl deacetylase
MVMHVYLSPHLDDAVYSCGGLIFQQAQRSEGVLILTICAGEPTGEDLSPFALELHARWEEIESPIQLRRQEDSEACAILGAAYKHLEIPDCVYRKGENGADLYPDLTSLVGPLASEEMELVEAVAAQIFDFFPTNARLYSPACFGGHVDHRLTRWAAESLGVPLHYYHDLPYAGRDLPLPDDLRLPAGEVTIHALVEEEIAAWADAALAYTSQLTTFWPDAISYRAELQSVLENWGGIPILRSGSNS